MPPTTHQTCFTCGTPADLFPVVDELGRTDLCGLCLIQVLARWAHSGDVTVFLARPHAVA
jgi:hypothetical protein